MLKLFSFKVLGTSPLLTHNPASMAVGGNAVSRKAETHDPKVDAELGVYRDEAGHCCIPAIAFRRAVLTVSARFKGKGGRSFKTYIGHIRTPEEFFVLTDPETEEPLTKWDVDIRRVMVQKNGILRARPRFDSWACYVKFLADPEICGLEDERVAELLKACLNEAGQTVGVGDYRLEKGGWFGMFKVAE